jgi:hypothetical protein
MLLLSKGNQNMTEDLMQAALATWAAKNLPARLDVVATAKLLGFAEHDIQILMAVGKLTPLGDPAPNAPKWFAAVEMIRLAADMDWLHKATKEIAKYWRHKRERRQAPGPSSNPAPHQAIKVRPEKVTPNSSPKVTPDGQFRGGEWAMRSVEQVVANIA